MAVRCFGPRQQRPSGTVPTTAIAAGCSGSDIWLVPDSGGIWRAPGSGGIAGLVNLFIFGYPKL